MSPEFPPGAERYLDRCRLFVVDHLLRLPNANYHEAWSIYRALPTGEGLRPCERALAGLMDRYYLLVFLLGRRDLVQHGDYECGRFGDPDYAPAGNVWLYDRVREVERDPDNRLDLWSREAGKSSVITFGGIIQEVLRNPELTVAIFSVTRPLAKRHLQPIKRAFEMNRLLKETYADVLFEDPASEAPKWSEDGGLVIKRKGVGREGTVEAWGLIDGMPTGGHYGLRVYDDVITEKHSKSPEMVKKALEQFELSDNLGRKGGRKWVIGTRYSFGDVYGILLDRKVLVPRVHPATADGTLHGRPVFLSQAQWEDKKRNQPTTVAAQMLQDPAGGQDTTFTVKWLRAFEVRPDTLNVYILVDPSKGRTRTSDRTAMAVVGIDSRENKYLLDGFCHRMNLAERRENLLRLHEKWRNRPGVLLCEIGYEQYGLQVDLEHFEQMARIDGKPLPVQEVNWVREGGQSKQDRVERLVPDFAGGRFFLPLFCYDAAIAASAAKNDPHAGLVRWRVEEGRIYWERAERGDRTRARAEAQRRGRDDLIIGPIKRFDENRQPYDLTVRFIEEYTYFPFGAKKDLIDAVSRVYDMRPAAPVIVRPEDVEPAVYVDGA